MPGQGVDLRLVGLRVADTGLYKCTVNVNKQATDIIHKEQQIIHLIELCLMIGGKKYRYI